MNPKYPKIGNALRKRHGKDYFSKIGKIGGSRKSQSKGFGSLDIDKLREVARKGGEASKKEASRKT